MLNTKIQKENFDSKLYQQCAEWANANTAKIVEYDDYYEVVDNTPTEEQLKAQEKSQLTDELTKITAEIAQLNGASMCGLSVDTDTEYDIIKDGELVTLNEEEFNAYFDELTDKRSEIVEKLRGL